MSAHVSKQLHTYSLTPAGFAYNSFLRSNQYVSVTALIDSGANHSFVSPAIVQQYGLLLETCDYMLD